MTTIMIAMDLDEYKAFEKSLKESNMDIETIPPRVSGLFVYLWAAGRDYAIAKK